MAWDYDDEEINGIVDSNLKDSPPNPPAVNTASTMRSMLKTFWAAIRGQVSTAVDYTDEQIVNTLNDVETQLTTTLADVMARTLAAEAKAESVYSQFSLADRLGTYNAATGLYTISETGATGNIVAMPNFGKGKYFDVVVPATNNIPGNGTEWKTGDRIISAITKWDRIPYSDFALRETQKNASQINSSLLMENLVAESARLDLWQKVNVTTSLALAESGLSHGIRLTETAINAEHFINSNRAISLVEGQPYTFSVYVKAGTRTSVAMTLGVGATWGGNSVPELRVNLLDGTFIKNSVISDAGVVKINNGWFRIWMTSTTHISGVTLLRLRLTNSGTQQYLGDITNYADFCYPQVSQSSGLIQYTFSFDNPVQKKEGQLTTTDQQKTWNNKLDDSAVNTEVFKNKFNIAFAKDGYYLNAANVETANPAYGYGLEYIPVLEGVIYTAWSGSQGARFICFYDADKNLVSSLTATTKTFTVPAGVVYLRATYFIGEKATFQIEIGNNNTAFEAYKSIIKSIKGAIVDLKAADIAQDSLHRFVSDNEKSKWNSKLSPDAVVSIPSKNLFDLTKGTDGFTLNIDGSPQANVAYGYTDYIPVIAGNQYTGTGANSVMRRIHFYNGVKTFLSYIDHPINPVTIPAGAAFARPTYSVGDKATFQFESGNVKTGYVGFTPSLVSVMGAKVPDMSQVYSANIVFPSRVYAIVGREFNLYYDAFTLLPEYGAGVPNFLFDIVCSKGIMSYRSFRFTPTASDVGSYALTFNVLDNKGQVIDTASTTLVVVAANNPATVKHHLEVGDSTVDNPYLSSTIQSNLAALGGNVPVFHGQHYAAPGKNEARTGRTWGAFAGAASVVAYKFYVTGVSPTLDLSNIRNTYYSHGTSANQVILSERWKIDADGTGFVIGYYFGSFTMPTAFPTILTAQAVDPGFPATLNVINAEILNGFSIFKNADGMGALDISYYRQTVLGMSAGTKFDSVRFDLGLNDLSLGAIATDAQITAIINNAKLVIDAFIADNVNCKIVIALPKSHTSDYYVTSRRQSTYRISIQKLRKALIANFDFNTGYPNIYISQSGYSVDRFYGYPNSAQPPAARITTPTFLVTTDDVHPLPGGYYQNADGATGCLLYVLNL